MADIPLTVDPGGLFTRLGKLIYSIKVQNERRVSMGDDANAFVNQFNSSGQPIRDAYYNQLLNPARLSMSAYFSGIAAYAQSVLVTMANDSVPLAQKTTFAALDVLLRQMDGDNDTVEANTTSVSVATGGSNTGNAVCAASLVNAAGLTMEYCLAEDITLIAANDSQAGTVTQGRESWSVTSPVPEGDQLSWNWPKGSGIATTITAAASDGGRQLLANGDFEDWDGTPLAAEQWTAVTGTYATNLVRAATPHLGTYSLSMVGDGATQLAVKQEFNDGTNGTATRLKPSTVYAVCYFVKMSATPAAGVLGASLVNSSNTVINNDAGTPNTVSKDLTSVSTSWVAVTGFFQTPAVLPSGDLYLLVKLTTALSNTRTLYIDDLTMIEPTQVYRGGPYIAVYPGDTATIRLDRLTVTVANDWAGLFQSYFQRFFNMRDLGFQLPSAGSPTISESLVNGTF